MSEDNNNGGQGDNSSQDLKKEEQKQDEKNIQVPKFRLDEESKKRQEAERKLEEYEKKQKEAEAKKLEEEGEYKKLLEQERAEKENLRVGLERQKKIDAIKTEAVKRGANNPDVVARLVDLDQIKLSEDGSIDQEAVKGTFDKLVESEAYLFNGSKPKNIGGEGGAPDGSTQTVKQFKRSQIKDAKFYRENEKDIELALKTGNIINDINP